MTKQKRIQEANEIMATTPNTNMNKQFEVGQQVKVQLYQGGELYPAKVYALWPEMGVVIVTCKRMRTMQNYRGIVDVDVTSVFES